MDREAITDMAYLAGFFDGEGCIQIVQGQTEPKGNLRISVSQRVSGPLELFHACFGGSEPKQYASQGNQWVWSLYALNAARALERMAPYLLVKQRQAVLAMEYQLAVSTNNWTRESLAGIAEQIKLYKRPWLIDE